MESYPEPSERTVFIRGMQRAIKQDRQLLEPLKAAIHDAEVTSVDEPESSSDAQELAE